MLTTSGLEFGAAIGLGYAAVEPDQELCERLRAGEVSAVARAYDLYADRVRALARRLTGEPDSAEDLVQDLFVGLPKAVRRFRGDSSLSTFLLSITVNLSRRHIRSAVRRRAATTRFRDERGGSAAPAPEVELERRQLAVALGQALDSLSHDHRVTFVLSDVEERPSPEVARILDVPEATVRTRLFHARRKLREHLAKQGMVPEFFMEGSAL